MHSQTLSKILSITCISIQVALPEIWRNSLLTAVVGTPSTCCKAAKNGPLNKFLKCVLKFSEKFLERALQWGSFLVNSRPTNYSLKSCLLLKFWKIPEITQQTFILVKTF